MIIEPNKTAIDVAFDLSGSLSGFPELLEQLPHGQRIGFDRIPEVWQDVDDIGQTWTPDIEGKDLDITLPEYNEVAMRKAPYYATDIYGLRTVVNFGNETIESLLTIPEVFTLLPLGDMGGTGVTATGTSVSYNVGFGNYSYIVATGSAIYRSSDGINYNRWTTLTYDAIINIKVCNGLLFVMQSGGYFCWMSVDSVPTQCNIDIGTTPYDVEYVDGYYLFFCSRGSVDNACVFRIAEADLTSGLIPHTVVPFFNSGYAFGINRAIRIPDTDIIAVAPINSSTDRHLSFRYDAQLNTVSLVGNYDYDELGVANNYLVDNCFTLGSRGILKNTTKYTVVDFDGTYETVALPDADPALHRGFRAVVDPSTDRLHVVYRAIVEDVESVRYAVYSSSLRLLYQQDIEVDDLADNSVVNIALLKDEIYVIIKPSFSVLPFIYGTYGNENT